MLLCPKDIFGKHLINLEKTNRSESWVRDPETLQRFSPFLKRKVSTNSKPGRIGEHLDFLFPEDPCMDIYLQYLATYIYIFGFYGKCRKIYHTWILWGMN